VAPGCHRPSLHRTRAAAIGPGGRDGRHCRRAAAGGRNQALIPTKMADVWAGERDGRRGRRVKSGCRRLPSRTIKLAAVGSNRPTATADTTVGGGIRAAVDFLLAAVAGRRWLACRLKPAAAGTRRSNWTTSLAAGDWTRGTGTDLPASTCERSRAVKFKELSSPAATAPGASLPIASLHQAELGAAGRAASPLSRRLGPLRDDWWPPGGHASRQASGDAARHDDCGPPGGQASRHSGGHAAPYDNWGPPDGGSSQAGDWSRYVTTVSRRSVPDFRTPAAPVRVGGPLTTGEVYRRSVLDRSLTGRRHRAAGKRSKQSGTRPAATDTRRQVSTDQYLPVAADNCLRRRTSTTGCCSIPALRRRRITSIRQRRVTGRRNRRRRAGRDGTAPSAAAQSPLAGGGRSPRAGGGALSATGTGGDKPGRAGPAPPAAAQSSLAAGGASRATGVGGDASRTEG